MGTNKQKAVSTGLIAGPIKPTAWTITQKILASGALVLAMALVFLWGGDWRQNKFSDVLVYLAVLLIIAGVCLCIIRRYRNPGE